MQSSNVYLNQIYQVLPRVLALFNNNRYETSCGLGDRLHWAWKLTDFSNATFQGAANGLTRLLVNDLLPLGFSQEKMLARIHDMICATKRITRSNGSLEEAFPYESSFCVTALIAYDLLTAIELLQQHQKIAEQSYQDYLAIIKPLINFLKNHNETHGKITNHLATAAAALFKWAICSNDPDLQTAEALLATILEFQSSEGWYAEYAGADPGYQTLCTYYLADIYHMTKRSTLLESLQRSIKFLSYCIHPDGSVGGYYGSRNTRFYYPPGLELHASEIASFMRVAIDEQQVVTLAAMDEANLMPMFNAYCWAASIGDRANQHQQDQIKLPLLNQQSFQQFFPEAGLFIRKYRQSYTVISLHKGGVVQHYRDRQLVLLNVGVVVQKKQNFYSSQSYSAANKYHIDRDQVRVQAPLCQLNYREMTPGKLLILRLLNLTVMRVDWMSALIKRCLVKFLITGRKELITYNERTFTFNEEEISVADQLHNNHWQLEILPYQLFSAIHMASQGYWQRSDDFIC